jgi:hypothetical protein
MNATGFSLRSREARRILPEASAAQKINITIMITFI